MGDGRRSGVLLRQKSIFHFSEAPSTTFHPSVQAFSENLLRASFGSPSLSIISAWARFLPPDLRGVPAYLAQSADRRTGIITTP